MTSYRDAGVNIQAKTDALNSLKDVVQSTHTAGVLLGLGAFGGSFDLGTVLRGIREPVLVASTDSIGTKVLVACAVGSFDELGADLVNHCINDILCQGAVPLFFLDYFAASKLDPAVITAVISSVAQACREAHMPLLGGETAELPDVYAEQAFDVAGTIVGVADRAALISGRAVVPGDVILALPSTGLHTNGYSLARRVLGPLGYDSRPELLGGRSIGAALLAPHRSYLNQIKALRRGGITIHGLAHVTGGGLWDNLPRVLPDGIGATIQRGSWDIPPIFKLIIEHAAINEHEAFHTFNMGLGMLVIVPEASAEAARAIVQEARIVGQIVPWDGQGDRIGLIG